MHMSDGNRRKFYYEKPNRPRSRSGRDPRPTRNGENINSTQQGRIARKRGKVVRSLETIFSNVDRIRFIYLLREYIGGYKLMDEEK